ncbi:MAG TPA: hypothetical protein VGY97_05050 [Solirubrobacteraceae bacterium]|jgi:hypothetical protein|nr:hypothetical protein [Solirubrobacteraceae bacterium]
MRRLVISLVVWATVALVLAPVALAQNSGEGLYGPADDKVVTDAGFILIAAFPLLALALSLLQWRLEKRKDARKAAMKARLSSADWRGGW